MTNKWFHQITFKRNKTRKMPSNPRTKTHSKLTGKWVLSMFLLSLFCILGYVYANWATLSNLLALSFLSPKSYYSYVERKSLAHTANLLSLTNTLTPERRACELTSDITLHRAELDSALQNAYQTDLTEVEELLGLKIESLGGHAILSNDGNLNYEKITLNLNKNKLLAGEAYLRSSKPQFLFRLPDLSDAFLSPSIRYNETKLNVIILFLNLLTSDKGSALVTRYGQDMITNISKVQMQKDVTLSEEFILIPCTKLTIELSKEDLLRMATKLHATAATDEQILSMLGEQGLTKAQYRDLLSKFFDTLRKRLQENPGKGRVRMEIYVNEQGQIISRQWTDVLGYGSFGYSWLTQGNHTEYQLQLQEHDDRSHLLLTGSHNLIEGSYDGSMKLQYLDPNAKESKEEIIDIAYEDVQYEYKNNHLYQSGSYTMTSLDFMGIQFETENKVEGNTQTNQTIVRMGASPLVTIQSRLNYFTPSPISYPNTEMMIYDTEQMDEYLSTFEWENYLDILTDRFHVSLQDLLDSYHIKLPGE